MSPCTNWTPARASRVRFNSEPRRCKLSRTRTRAAGNCCLRVMAKVAPTKPAPPVISMHSYMVPWQRLLLFSAESPVIIASGKIFLQPQVQHNEQISAPHLLEFEFGNTGFPVCPANRHDSEGVPAHNSLQW